MNLHSDSFSEIGRDKDKRKPRKGLPGCGTANFGTKSAQCKSGNHFSCLKKTCPCECGHGGIR